MKGLKRWIGLTHRLTDGVARNERVKEMDRVNSLSPKYAPLRTSPPLMHLMWTTGVQLHPFWTGYCQGLMCHTHTPSFLDTKMAFEEHGFCVWHITRMRLTSRQHSVLLGTKHITAEQSWALKAERGMNAVLVLKEFISLRHTGLFNGLWPVMLSFHDRH